MNEANLIILKTDIQSEYKLRLMAPLFDRHKMIEDWSVDLEDCDKVLRIEAQKGLTPNKVVRLMAEEGIYAVEL